MTIDGVNISTFMAVPVIAGEAIPLTGLFDLPKRKGETERNWGTSIEPYTDAPDIELSGRSLTLSVLISGSTALSYKNNLAAFKQACVDCRVLGTDFGNFNVTANDEIKVKEEYGHNIAIVTVKFWQETVVLPALTLTPSGGSGFLLDGYNLHKDFGIVVAERQSNQNIGKRIDVNTTLPYNRTSYRDTHSMNLKCSVVGSLSDLYARMMQFHTLCMKPGLRTLTFPDNSTVEIYIKDGLTVKVEHENVLTFDLKMQVV